MSKKEAEAPVPAVQGTAGVPSIIADYAFMAMTDPAVFQENIGSEPINPFDLPRLKVPSGQGAPMWLIPSLDGDPEVKKAVEGIIVKWREVRSFWASEFTGEGAPPDCQSTDCVEGHGSPGGKCALCPYAQFGSDKNKSGQACKLTRILFLMTKESVLPTVIVAPPTSVKPIRQYLLALAGKAIPYYTAVTSFALSPEKNKGGIAYFQIKPTKVAVLPPDEAKALKMFADSINGVLDKVEVQSSDVGAEAQA